ELSRFLTPPVVADYRNAPVNALGYLRVMFAVENIDETLARLGKRGAQLVGEVVQYKDAYRRCYIRGPEGLLIGLAQELRSERHHDRSALADRNQPGRSVLINAEGFSHQSPRIDQRWPTYQY